MKATMYVPQPKCNRKWQCQDLWKPLVTLPSSSLCCLVSMKPIYWISCFLCPCFAESEFLNNNALFCLFLTSYEWSYIQYTFSTCCFHLTLSSSSFSPLYQVVWLQYTISIYPFLHPWAFGLWPFLCYFRCCSVNILVHVSWYPGPFLNKPIYFKQNAGIFFILFKICFTKRVCHKIFQVL